jgi:NMD protein affecting ribosome stability and mRNA decay
MATPSHSARHEHTETTTHVLRQKAGVPYEIERVVCEACRKLLLERSLRRAAA